MSPFNRRHYSPSLPCYCLVLSGYTHYSYSFVAYHPSAAVSERVSYKRFIDGLHTYIIVMGIRFVYEVQVYLSLNTYSNRYIHTQTHTGMEKKLFT